MSGGRRSANGSTGEAHVRVSVHGIDGRVFDGNARVRLIREDEEQRRDLHREGSAGRPRKRDRGKPTGGTDDDENRESDERDEKDGDETVVLTRPEGSLLYEGHVEPGRYRLTVSTDELVAPDRYVEVGTEGKTASAYLGEEDWPFYRLGENLVPFSPPGDRLAVAFPLTQPEPESVDKLVEELTSQLPLEPDPIRDREEDGGEDRDHQRDFVVAEGAVWLFRLTEEDTPDLRRKASRTIREMIDEEEVRVGVPVDLGPGRVKVIDNRYVVRFHEDVEAYEIEERVEKAEGRILREFSQAPNARLVEFPAGDFRQHLATIEEWYEQGVLVYGEPDIMAELTDDAFPDDAPDDPTYANQANLTLQQVDVAWRILDQTDPNLTLGDPDVYVATLDRGVDLDHPDIGGTLTDGSPQVARCYDFSGLQECTVPGYTPDTDHGMGVYGIIAARTDNNEDIAGIAPNTHQIGMERPDLTSANYPDVLLWAAGFETENASSGWPAEPLAPGADIISCSHGSDGLALSGIMDDTFQELANNGRGGLGTLVVYSAGNANTLITGFRTWAAHPNTMAIANSTQPDGGGVERKVGSSNFGPEIDVCAQGDGAPSLDASGGEQTFGGTSAAAPTVAGIAALMLSLDDTLTWTDLRDRLRNTAVQIDAANTDPVGQWVGGFSQWYGFGRVDAADAVCGEEPTVTLQTPSLTFNDVPEDETTVRAAVFEAESCVPMTLSIVAGPGADFTTPLGTTDELDVAADASVREGRIWVGYTGTTDGDSHTGSVTVQWEETGQEWTIPISANTVSRPTVALELVLDQSASMGYASGIPDLPERVDVLQFSVPPLLEVLQEDNAIGIVSFDQDAHDVMPVTVAGPPVFGAGRAAAKTAVANHEPNPAGLTAIGDGIERASQELAPETGYDVKSMIVFTDGHETAAKYISDVSDLVNERVYAIGLGTAEQIQPAALTALTNGTGGYLLLTGDIADTDYFLLAKYYLQVLAGVTNEDIVLDPDGFIGPQQRHRIPFRLTETDIRSDVILLTPAPQAVRLSLETPDGDLITPSTSGGLPGTEYVAGQNVSYYRVSLPAPIGSGDGAAEGEWHAVLEVDPKYFQRYLNEVEGIEGMYQQVSTHGVQYSLNVHTYSNLRLRASIAQDSLEPGATMTVRAVLTEYGLPVAERATVFAELTRPDGTETTLTLAETDPGIFETTTTASASGVYQFRVRATGDTQRRQPFTREQFVTGAVWAGGDGSLPTSRDDPTGSGEVLCELLRCLLGRKTLSRDFEDRLREGGIDVDAARCCIERYCRSQES